MNNSYNVYLTQETKEELLCQIANSDDRELITLSCVHLPTRLQQNPARLKNDLLRALQSDRPISGWMLDLLSSFNDEILSQYNLYFNEDISTQSTPCTYGALDEAASFLLLIDGNNLIHDKFNSPFDDQHFPKGLSWNQAKDIFLLKVDHILRARPAASGRVYMDRSRYSQHPHSKQLRVIYSGGGDATDRADRAILADLEVYQKDLTDELKVVVTDDRWLRERAADSGASLLNASEFFNLMRQTVAA